MNNFILDIFLIISYILNSIYILKQCQDDNYHIRSFKDILRDDLIKKPYIFLLFLFNFVENNSVTFHTILLILILIIIENIYKNSLKIKFSKRMIRLLEIDLFIFLLFFIVKPLINGLLIANSFYILLNYIAINIANLIENILLKRYINQAKKRVNLYNPYIIGITGSCGKTSIKNYIYNCLEDEFLIYKTPKSYNTLVGILITINKYLNSFENTFILEMGLSYKKDIKKITKLVKPNISIITEILPSHLQTMKTIENIIEEKMNIVKDMKPGGTIIINNDNEYIKRNINKYNINNNKVIKIGFNKENDYYCNNYIIKKDGISMVLIDNILKKQYNIESKLIGRHNIYNILITYSVLKELNIDEIKIIKQISKLSNYENRLEIKKYNEMTILNDSYNSNINGFINALEILSLYDSLKYIITPGIVESGKENINIINEISEKIINICDYCYIINNKNTKYFIEYFEKNNFKNYTIKNTFLEAFNEVKNKKITLLIENDLPEFYLMKNHSKRRLK